MASETEIVQVTQRAREKEQFEEFYLEQLRNTQEEAIDLKERNDELANDLLDAR